MSSKNKKFVRVRAAGGERSASSASGSAGFGKLEMPSKTGPGAVTLAKYMEFMISFTAINLMVELCDLFELNRLPTIPDITIDRARLGALGDDPISKLLM